MRRALLAGLLLLLPAVEAIACSEKQRDPEELVRNEPVYSANRRYCAILRRYDISDFGHTRAGTLFHLDPEYADEKHRPLPEPKHRTVAWYEVTPSGHRLIAELQVDGGLTDLLVADSGRYVVAVRQLHGGIGIVPPEANDQVIAVYGAPGYFIGSLTTADVLVENDFSPTYVPETRFALRSESEESERLVVAFDVSSDWKAAVWKERRIDLARPRLLDEKRPLFPTARIYAEPARGITNAPSNGRVVIEPDAFLAALVDAPLPEVSRVATGLRIRGIVVIEADVDERGSVEALRVVKPLPFDIATATAVRQWRFRPFRLDGRPVKATGTLVFRVADLDEATWNEKRVAPFR